MNWWLIGGGVALWIFVIAVVWGLCRAAKFGDQQITTNHGRTIELARERDKRLD